MINLIILKDNYQVHYHKFSDEYYLPLYGKLRLVTYDYKNKIKSYEDLDGKKKTIKCEGLLSTCLQHEINHLDGKLIIDHLSKLKRDIIIKKISKTKKNLDRVIV